MSNKAIIGVESHDRILARALSVARRFDAGERLPEADYYLNFSSATQLFSELTPARMRTLETLKATGPLRGYPRRAIVARLSRGESDVSIIRGE